MIKVEHNKKQLNSARMNKIDKNLNEIELPPLIFSFGEIISIIFIVS